MESFEDVLKAHADALSHAPQRFLGIETSDTYTWYLLISTAFICFPSNDRFFCQWGDIVLASSEQDAIERGQQMYAPDENDRYSYTVHKATPIRYTIYAPPIVHMNQLKRPPFFKPLFEMNDLFEVYLLDENRQVLKGGQG